VAAEGHEHDTALAPTTGLSRERGTRSLLAAWSASSMNAPGPGSAILHYPLGTRPPGQPTPAAQPRCSPIATWRVPLDSATLIVATGAPLSHADATACSLAKRRISSAREWMPSLR
jgi:hypothetical protein